MAEYSLPKWLRDEMEHDIALRKVIQDGERQNAPIVSMYQAVTGMLLERQKFLFVDLMRYRKQYGDLPPLDLTGSKASAEAPHEGYGTEPERDNDEHPTEKKEGEAESEQPSGTFKPRRIVYGENGATDHHP